MAERGAVSLGTMTIVLPLTTAGAQSEMKASRGYWSGQAIPMTPTGSLIRTVHPYSVVSCIGRGREGGRMLGCGERRGGQRGRGRGRMRRNVRVGRERWRAEGRGGRGRGEEGMEKSTDTLAMYYT